MSDIAPSEPAYIAGTNPRFGEMLGHWGAYWGEIRETTGHDVGIAGVAMNLFTLLSETTVHNEPVYLSIAGETTVIPDPSGIVVSRHSVTLGDFEVDLLHGDVSLLDGEPGIAFMAYGCLCRVYARDATGDSVAELAERSLPAYVASLRDRGYRGVRVLKNGQPAGVTSLDNVFVSDAFYAPNGTPLHRMRFGSTAVSASAVAFMGYLQVDTRLELLLLSGERLSIRPLHLGLVAN